MSQNYPASSLTHDLTCFPYGVGHGMEGVCLLVKMGPHRILLDCGLEDPQPLRAEQPSFAFCSHAHDDHARGLLAFHELFPPVPIYASAVTIELLPLNWPTVESVSGWCEALPWRSPLELEPGLVAEIFPAGHLPGAAAILLTYQSSERAYTLLYTGDFCLSNFQLVEGLSVEALRGLAPDVLIIEGSYGTARHVHRRQQEKQLMQRIHQALLGGQNVLLPVPTLGIGQEILKLLRSHHQFTGRDLDIWVEGNVAQACDIYLQLLSQFPASVQNFAQHQPLFWDERVCPRMHRITPQSQPQGPLPHIIITSNAADLQEYCSSSDSWLVLLPEHPRGTLDVEPLLGRSHLEVETYLLAEHSDGRNTTQLIHNLRPQHVVFVHGSPAYLADLTSLEELQTRYQLHSPSAGTLVNLPVGSTFLQPAVPHQAYYDGEINEVETITITLTKAISSDPRWANLADTGVIEARWQGDELVLRGLSQRELISQNNEARALANLDCCGTCLHYRKQHCRNPASHLYGLKVTPQGYCPAYEESDEEDDYSDI
ncbi:MAG: MBL fold metallo-hydrolase [Cyanophyceae cyanobacterium]